MNRIAKVAVDLSLDREFDYLIPESLQAAVEIGSRVEVPFGKRSVTGFVVGLAEKSDFDELKPIGKVLGEKSLVTETVMELARWMSAYYLAPFETCVRSVLPAVVRNKASGAKTQLTVSLVEKNVDATPSSRFLGFDSAHPVSYPSGGNLPHWRQDGTTYFITFRLADSLPKGKLDRWKRGRDLWLEENPRPTDEENVDAPPSSRLTEWQKEYRSRFTEKFEQWLDAGEGSCLLKQPELREALVEIFQKKNGQKYWLEGYVVMPNHIHALLTPIGEHRLSAIVQSWKSISTRRINELRGGKGSVWQKESFDHIVRNAESLLKFQQHIEDNPKFLKEGQFELFLTRRGRRVYDENPGDVPSALTPKQQAVIDVLQTASPMLLSELTVQAEVSAGTVKTLEKKGLVVISSESIYRDPHEGIEILKTEPLKLMPQQADALEKIIGAMAEPEPPVLLLHGVTGSGKTEVYLQAIAHALEQGRGAIVLVPEIALTPQTVDRFRARFADKPERVAVLHSSLSDGERYDEWHRIRSGEAQIVIGARSALFAPVENLGLIVVDEEHEPTYKQDEAPRYSARDAAVMRGRMEHCAVVLGSATPALESYCNAKNGKYTYLDLPVRVDHRRMPAIRIVDMRIEAQRTGQHGLFSKELIEAIYCRLDRAEQTMIFLNRRGFSSSLVCPDCGTVSECEHCSVSMTYHKARARLVCHICGEEKTVPVRCPECASKEFKYSGAGTEKIEEVMAKLFPKARIARMDSDTMRKKNAHRDVLAQFRVGKIDILIGTQMIAKGLDFPNVTLVGVVNPDHALHMADFRAGERVFQLLTQVAGRAGRGEVEGEVLVQTHTPHHPAIQFARRMDFEGFCDQELAFRKELRYPPYAHLTCITLRGKHEATVEKTGEQLFQWLEKCVSQEVMLSPLVPAPISRARGEYRYQILLRAEKTGVMTRAIRRAVGAIEKWPKGVKCTIDVDATSLL
ncbi:MAG: primosomal protein N' [Kiritimatiellales bacterium]|nr:primosomal protein N' [Kiritimatiellota bacterium]MBL7012359.1 primosomal protein N' [Kiritimatiellales bacterium]